MKFVVSDTCRLGLELIKGNSLIAIRKVLDFERVCMDDSIPSSSF